MAVAGRGETISHRPADLSRQPSPSGKVYVWSWKKKAAALTRRNARHGRASTDATISIPVTPSDTMASHSYIEQAFNEQASRNEFNNNGLKIIADENMELSTARILERNGYRVVSVSKTLSAGRSDEYLWEEAQRLKAIIISNDRDYLDTARFTHADSPGVVMFTRKLDKAPSEEGGVVVLKSLRNFMAMSREIEEWQGVVMTYDRDGKPTFVHQNSSKPMRRNQNRLEPPVLELS
jgi:predicted nuclease of predicted toxin-antitoxin system